MVINLVVAAVVPVEQETELKKTELVMVEMGLLIPLLMEVLQSMVLVVAAEE